MIFGFVLLCVCVCVHECVHVFRMFLSELRINVFSGARNADFIKELGESVGVNLYTTLYHKYFGEDYRSVCFLSNYIRAGEEEWVFNVEISCAHFSGFLFFFNFTTSHPMFS